MFFYLHLVCETHCAAGRTLGQNIVKSRSSTVSPNIVKPQGKRCKIPLPFFCFAFFIFRLVDTKRIIFMFCCSLKCEVFINKKNDRFNGYQAFNKQKTTFLYDRISKINLSLSIIEISMLDCFNIFCGVFDSYLSHRIIDSFPRILNSINIIFRFLIFGPSF